MRHLTEEEIAKIERKREINRKYMERYRLAKPEMKNEWAARNKEHVTEYNREYAKRPIGRAVYLLSSYNREDRVHDRGKGDLTAQWILENIFTKPCVHCGETDWHKLGCNRLDNTKPHTIDNVEPCCMECNKKLGGDYNRTRYSKKVFQYTLDGELVKVWDSACECDRDGFDKCAISACCRGKYGYKTHKGYRWSYTTL